MKIGKNGPCKRKKLSIETVPEETQILTLLKTLISYYKSAVQRTKKKKSKELKYENDVSPNCEYQGIEIIKKN